MADIQHNFPEKNSLQNENSEILLSQSSSSLSDEEFETLIKSMQLLRISQLRYLVQKFSIPASGNKTKLLGLMISIFQGLRYDKILIQIYQEINTLISQQEEPFSNPLMQVDHIDFAENDPSFIPLEQPLYQIFYQTPSFGPLSIPSGSSNGSFTFSVVPDHFYLLTFLFKNGISSHFSLQIDINGYVFEVNSDDPYPQPIDISNILVPTNFMNIKFLNVVVPMRIAICEYLYFGLSKLVNQICGQNISISSHPQIFVKSSNCSHPESFSLLPFLSKSLATHQFLCPICNKTISISELKVQETPVFPSEALSDIPFPPSHHNSDYFFQMDNFKSDFYDWDGF